MYLNCGENLTARLVNFDHMTIKILIGDVREQLKTLADESVHCVVTSPPYWGLRCYGVDGQLGLEPTYQEHVSAMVEVFREVRRVLRRDGTCWINYGDCYVTSPPGNKHGTVDSYKNRFDRQLGQGESREAIYGDRVQRTGLPAKNLVGVPWRVAFALQADGWWLRQDIVWSKPNPMPESVKDRCTKAHEYIFLLTKSPRYYFDAEAIKEANSEGSIERFGITDEGQTRTWNTNSNKRDGRGDGTKSSEGFRVHVPLGRNKRSVWEIATSPFPEAHFATFPPELPELCIKAGTSEKGCCGKCGKPWERKTEVNYLSPIVASEPKDWVGTGPGRRPAREAVTRMGDGKDVKTIGWSLPCKCYPGSEILNAVPCTVLDPFFGAGTTGLVADRLQRNCIGIELNPEYAAIAKRRIYGDAPMFAEVE